MEHSKEPHPFEIICPSLPGRHPLICITPLMGQLVLFEDLHFERIFARYFSQNGFAVLLMHRPIFSYDPNQNIEQIKNYVKHSLERNQSVLEAVLKNPSVDSSRMGTFGISFGSIINLLWASKDPRLKTHVFALTGAPLPEICITSTDPLMRSIMSDMMNHAGLRSDELLEALRSQLDEYDPLRAAESIQNHPTLFALALFDRVIQFQYGMNLQRRFKQASHIYIPLGHYLTVLTVPILKRSALLHFQKHLSQGLS